jgi:hypothetical protein
LDLVRGAGRWIRARYIRPAADDGRRPNSSKTSLMNVVVGVAQVSPSLLSDTPIIVEDALSFFLIELTFKHQHSPQ